MKRKAHELLRRSTWERGVSTMRCRTHRCVPSCVWWSVWWVCERTAESCGILIGGVQLDLFIVGAGPCSVFYRFEKGSYVSLLSHAHAHAKRCTKYLAHGAKQAHRQHEAHTKWSEH